MENQNVNQNQQPQGWRGVTITPDMPLGAIVQFFNILNQRLCNLEDNVTVNLQNEMVSLTRAYEIQAELEKQAQQEQKGE
jgi:hypothetical protein